MIPDAPTETIRVYELAKSDRLIVPMTGEIETVLAPPRDGLVSTDGTGPHSAYMWDPNDPIDVVSRATGS